MKNSKIIACLLIIVMTLLSLSGCKETGLDESGRKIINVWHYWDDTDSAFYLDLKTAIDAFQESHPELIISLDTLPESEYRSKLATSFNEEGGKGIDVFAFWGGYQTQNLQGLDLLLPLNSYVSNDTAGRVFQGGFSAFDQNDKVYALPTYSWTSVLYCNKALFDECNIEIPETLEDVVQSATAFTNAGLIPLALGGEDGWQLNFLFESILMRMTGAGNIAAFLDGNTDLADGADFQAATELFKSFHSNKMLGSTPMVGDARSADDLFIHGEAAMRLTGSWLSERIEVLDDQEFAGNIIAIPFPQVVVDGQNFGDTTELLGGYTHSFFVNNNTKHKAEAAELCIALSEALGNSAEENHIGNSAWTTETLGDGELSRSISQMSKEATVLIPSWDTFIAPANVDGYVTAVNDVFTGKITTLEFLNKLKHYVSEESEE